MSEVITISGGTLLTKSLKQARAQHIVQSVNNGRVNPLDAYMQSKFIIECLEEANQLIKEEAMQEAARYPKGDRVRLGVAFDLREGQERIDYDADPEYARIKAELKAREELLKQATKGKGETLDPGSGEVIAKLPIKGTAPAIAITFPK
jgi:hypothetical protein